MSDEQFKDIDLLLTKHLSGPEGLLTQLSNLQKDFTSYVEADMKWKEEAQPSIELGRNVTGFGRVLAYILGTLAAIYGIIKIFK